LPSPFDSDCWDPAPSGGVLDRFVDVVKIIERVMNVSAGNLVQPLNVAPRCKRFVLFAYEQNAMDLEVSR
jgi:hypothetical protein